LAAERPTDQMQCNLCGCEFGRLFVKASRRGGSTVDTFTSHCGVCGAVIVLLPPEWIDVDERPCPMCEASTKEQHEKSGRGCIVL
jgi:rubredoxin